MSLKPHKYDATNQRILKILENADSDLTATEVVREYPGDKDIDTEDVDDLHGNTIRNRIKDLQEAGYIEESRTIKGATLLTVPDQAYGHFKERRLEIIQDGLTEDKEAEA